jgi:hypothetical protein
MILDTDRLSLRRWRDAFARMNADARVMEFMPGLLTRGQSDNAVDRIELIWAVMGLGQKRWQATALQKLLPDRLG